MNISKNITGFIKGFQFISLILAMAIMSCSEQIDFSEGVKELPDGYLRLDLAVPDPVRVNTRAGESDIQNLEVFIFSKDENTFYQHLSYPGTSLTNGSVGVALNGAARNAEITIYAVANNETCKDIQTVAGLKEHVISSLDQENTGLPMLGFQSVNTAVDNNATISLYRAVAKLSAKSSVANTSVSQLRIYEYSKEAYLGAYHNNDSFIIKESPKASGKEEYIESQPATGGAVSFAFTFPSKGMDMTFDENYGRVEDAHYGAFIILQVERNGEKQQKQYYRINLRKEDENGELEFLDLLPNHHYSVEITGFLTDGYPSYEEAFNHPESDQFVTYKIHDHAMEIRSMVTDGYNELGVTPEVTFNSSSDEKMVVVKIFSPEESNYDKTITVTSSSNWIEVTGPTPHIYKGEGYEGEEDPDNPFKEDYNKTWDEDTPGKQYEYKVKINNGAKDYEDLIGEITFNWNGLSRTVKVNFEASFLLPQACSVTLTINSVDKNGSQSQFAKINDYWTFVTAIGESPDKNGTTAGVANTPRLFGIKPENLVGSKKRMNGFHFPMPYGELHKDKPWTYVYTVDFAPLLEQPDIKGKTIESISANITSTDENLMKDGLINWNYTYGNSGTLTFNQSVLSDKYEYLGGTISFNINYKDDNYKSEVHASLYHTGFFHYEGDSKYAPETEKGYYYYEVLPMAGSHWLDRNIGAKANKSYIDTEDVSADTGRESAGRHYTIINELQDLQLPVFDFEMIPPGYHVPNSTEWDDLRLHDNFITQTVTVNSTLYMSTFYQTNNSKIGNVYFQKARFCNRKNIYQDQTTKYTEKATAGDAGAGYYWSVTEAPAMEKEQMGNWLRALYLNGSSSTYNNASVTDHRMPIRCIAGTYDERKITPENYISFNVHEATHVYLYTKVNPTPLYTFPGKAIGTSDSAEKWQHFYCSTTQDPEDLLMVFVKLQDDGKVMIRKKSGDSFVSTQEFDKVKLAEEGWSVAEGLGKYFDFCEVGQDRPSCVFVPDDKKEPTDCNTGNSGGGGGDSTYKQGGNEKSRGNIYTPGEDELKIWEGSHIVNWDQTKVYFDYWEAVPVGTMLRLYGYSAGWAENQVDIRPHDWNGKFLNTDDGYFEYGGVDGYVEIELTQDLLNDIKYKKLMITGKGFNLTYVTLTPKFDLNIPEAPKVTPDSDREHIIWEGNQYVSWDGGPSITITSWDNGSWSSLSGSATLKVYAYSQYSGGEWYCYSLRYNDWNNLDGDLGQQVDNPSGSQSFNLTSGIISKLASTGGLLITGKNCVIRLVTIQ